MSRAGNILVLDDDAAIRTVVAHALRRAGHHVTTTATLAEFNRELRASVPDVVVSDVVLPDGNGLDMVAGLSEAFPQLPVIVLSAQNTLTTAVRATEVGAYEYLPKPFDLNDLTRAIDGALARRGEGESDPVDAEDRALPLIGRSPAMQDVYRVIARVISNDLTVLISGESGTGKELVAPRDPRPRPAPCRAVPGDQHGGDPARTDRGRAVRPRAWRLHRRAGPQRRPVRAGRGRHAVPRRNRRHADRGADAAAARAAIGRIHHSWWCPHDQGRRADRRRHQPRPRFARPVWPLS